MSDPTSDRKWSLEKLATYLHARIDGSEMIYEALDLVHDVIAVTEEMKDSCDIYQGHIGLSTRVDGLEARTRGWIAILEGKDGD